MALLTSQMIGALVLQIAGRLDFLQTGAQALLRMTEPITRIRGREYAYREAVLMPTYHPAYLLRSPSYKRMMWQDLRAIAKALEQTAS